MEKKNLDWSNIGFGYVQTDKRYVSNFKDGAWDEGGLTDDANVVLNECAGVLQYAQTVFDGYLPPGPERRAYGSVCKASGDAGIPGGSLRGRSCTDRKGK